ncbi:MAG: Stp1/IreP family PP2C-type Ser/Thr phosphatase [Myxococcales bacterium]|nr:Stp1/IreP family PP2C-type Ser/Thr phosphatase [Myxococcales bacterium]MCB9535036.1 Stp1/IreP family PP2C-type Ser/Thr phosphatase [Myxococcales bacterium]
MNKTNRRELRGRLPRLDTARPDFRVVGDGGTDVGLRREVNEDSFLMLPKNAVWIVADGMGGHAGGQVASTLTVKTVGTALLRRLYAAEQHAQQDGGRVNVPRIMEEAVREACATVFDTAREQPELTGMGSTVTVLLVYGSVAYFGHVGDSRAYLIRDGEIHQVTEDHSLVQEQVAAGLITPEQAKVSVMRNIITRSIGFEREVKVDTSALPLRVGDQFVLCSDGLTGHVEDDEIQSIVQREDRRRAPRTLIDLANSRGGEDNCTVVLTTVLGRRGRQRDKRSRS